MQQRQLDWRSYANRLVFCYGCGRFGMPRRGTNLPRGWKLLYQPYDEAPPGLHACRDRCADEIRFALKQGPICMPLKENPQSMMMPADLQSAMMDEAENAYGSVSWSYDDESDHYAIYVEGVGYTWVKELPRRWTDWLALAIILDCGDQSRKRR